MLIQDVWDVGARNITSNSYELHWSRAQGILLKLEKEALILQLIHQVIVSY